MKKNFLQDVIPASHKRSIRDIPLPQHRNPKKIAPKQTPEHFSEPKPEVKPLQPTQTPEYFNAQAKEPVFDPQRFNTAPLSNTDKEEDEYEDNFNNNHKFDNRQPPKKNLMKKILGAIILGVIISLIIFISRTQAIMTIHPKQGTYEVSTTIPLEGPLSQSTKTQLTQEAVVTLPATSEQQVERQAMGRIKITNNHAEISQDLVKNTRFQTPEGLVYRINQSITIPGFTSAGPGTIEVDVYADSAGEEYNIGMTKFTIPGFSGMDQFDKIKAESVTPMTGGYIGIKKVVSDEAMEEAEESLKEQLKSKFGTQAQISDSNIVVPDNETIQYSELLDSVEDNSVSLKMTASVDAYSFAKEGLMNYIGQKTIVGATNESEFYFDSSDLNYIVDSENKEIDITGSTTITWLTDIEGLKNNIAGKKKSEIADVINTYDSFEKTGIILKPLWKVKFPTNTDKIKIEVVS